MSTHPIYRDGETVRVTVTGTISGGEVSLAGHTFLPLDDPNLPVTVERIDPADGTPKPGQIWADSDGSEYYVTRPHSRIGRPAIYLTDVIGNTWQWRDIHAGPSGPITLVRDVTSITGEDAR
ncbi:hypothetical protein [Microtetraspora glauca]|uniref:Uncharacterized protein n=1 Tax=Microtetraspora glauca TaxID=1996 RepID=A0ABV3GAU5_MICGL